MIKIHCSHSAMVPIKELKAKFNPKNRNVHPPDQIDRLAKILEYQGARKAAVLSKRSGFLTAGHGRILAAERAGWTEYPVDYQDYESDEQEFADLTADNAVSLWAELDLAGINQDALEFGADFDLDMLGIKDFQLVDPTELEPGCDEDAVPEHVEPKSKLGDIYQLGRHRLMCGDSSAITNVDQLLAGEQIDMVHTDPPYGLADKWTGGTWGSNPMYADAKRWDQPLDADIVDWITTLAPVIIIWGGNYYRMPASRCWLSWIKTQQMETMADFELAWTNLDKVAKSWSGARNADGKRAHPTQKPVALMEWAISVHSDPKNVLDLFGGSGSTLIACEKTKRNCFMMELSPHYCDVIISRFEKYSGQKAVLTNG